jgi:hypothetical protein
MLLGMHSSGKAFRAAKSASSQVHLVFYDVTTVFSLLLLSSVCSVVFFCETPGFLRFHSFQICLVLSYTVVG